MREGDTDSPPGAPTAYCAPGRAPCWASAVSEDSKDSPPGAVGVKGTGLHSRLPDQARGQVGWCIPRAAPYRKDAGLLGLAGHPLPPMGQVTCCPSPISPKPLVLNCPCCLPATSPQFPANTAFPRAQCLPPPWPHLCEEEVSVDVDGGEHEAHEQHDHAHRQVADAAHRAPLLVALRGGPLLLWVAGPAQTDGGPVAPGILPPPCQSEIPLCWPGLSLGKVEGRWRG